MPVEILANQVSAGVLGSTLTNVATTITLSTGDGAKFPLVGPYRIAIADGLTGNNLELILIASCSGDVLTVASGGRGIEDTDAVEHTIGEIVRVSLTEEALQQVFAPFDLRFFGAVGDGVTDDSAALNAAITAANAAGGGTVRIVSGTYLIGATIVPKANVTVVGAGMHSTIIKLKDATNVSMMVATSAHRFALCDLTLDGNKANNTGGGNWSGLFLTTSDNVKVHRCRFLNIDWIAIAFAGCPDADIVDCSIESPDYIGIWLGVSGGTIHGTGSRIVRNTILDTGLDAVINGCDDVVIAHNYCRGNGRLIGASGIYMDSGTRRCRIEGNHCEGSTGHGIDLNTAVTDDSYGNIVIGNVCIGNRDSGIGCNANGTVIVGNTCENNGYAQGSAGAYPWGILLDAKYITCVGNRCTDTQGTPTQTYGISLRNVSAVTASCTIVGNDLAGNTNGGINALITIGTGHIAFANRGAPDLIQGPLAIGSLTSDHKLVLESAANDHIRLIRTGSSYLYDTYIDSSRVWYFNKPTGDTGSSLNALFKFGVIGGIDSINPYWNGYQFQGHTVTEAGPSRFPIMGFYSRSAIAADPTDYEFVFQVDNAGTLPVSMQYRLANVAGSYFRWRMFNTERMRLTYEGALNLSHIATPAAPGAGFTSLYFKTDNGIYIRPGTGGEVQIETRDRAGAVSGYATLDANTRVPDAQLGTGAASAAVFLRGDRSWAAGIDDIPRMLRPLAWLGAANLTTVTVLVTNTSYFLYIGRAGKALTTIDIVSRVTAAAATITWAEVGIFKGVPVANGAATALTRLGFTDVAATFNSTGIKKTTVALTGHAAEDDLWIAFGSQATTPYQIRAGLADDIQGGGFQSFAGRISTMGPSTGTLVAATLAVPMAQAVFI